MISPEENSPLGSMISFAVDGLFDLERSQDPRDGQSQRLEYEVAPWADSCDVL